MTFAAEEATSRYTIDHVRVIFREHSTTFEATDGRRISRAFYEAGSVQDGTERVILLPRHIAAKLSRISGKAQCMARIGVSADGRVECTYVKPRRKADDELVTVNWNQPENRRWPTTTDFFDLTRNAAIVGEAKDLREFFTPNPYVITRVRDGKLVRTTDVRTPSCCELYQQPSRDERLKKGTDIGVWGDLPKGRDIRLNGDYVCEWLDTLEDKDRVIIWFEDSENRIHANAGNFDYILMPMAQER